MPPFAGSNPAAPASPNPLKIRLKTRVCRCTSGSVTVTDTASSGRVWTSIVSRFVTCFSAFGSRSWSRPVSKRNMGFTPAAIDLLRQGSLLDPLTPGLRIELLASGKKKWKYHRRVTGSGEVVKATLGLFPACTIADARKWADALNERVEAGVDPREEERAARERAGMTVARAHAIYMEATREGRGSRAKRRKPAADDRRQG